MKNEGSIFERRKFVGWLGLLSIAGIAGNRLLTNIKETPKTVKMLTEDGKLVEVDAGILPGKRKRITDKELQSWVKK